MESFLHDARHALRALRRERGLVFLAVLALAMGIGFPTTMFSIVHGATRGLPFAEPDELVVVTRTRPERGIDDLRPRAWDLAEWRRGHSAFEALEAFRQDAANLASPEARPERISSTFVTAGAFGLLGARPALGRALRQEDALSGAPRVVVLSDRLWQSRFGADPAIVGREIRVDGEPHTIIGVMPEGFGFPINSQAWRPLVLEGASAPNEGETLTVFGRLREGVSLERARADMATLAQRLERADPAGHAGQGVRVLPFVDMEMDPAMVPVLYLMVSAVSLVLLIACANVANMLLARASARQRDIAVRTALGASRARIVAQHLVETAAVALVGGAIGIVMAHFGVRYFDRMSASVLEAFWLDFRVDGVVLAFSAALVAVAAIAAGIGPALQATRTSASALLRDGAGGMSSLRMGRIGRGLVVLELALACGLLAVAGAIVRGAVALRAVDLPFDADAVLTAQLALTPDAAADTERRDLWVRDIAERLGSAPDVRAAALTSVLPGPGGVNDQFVLDGTAIEPDAQLPFTAVAAITPGFLEVLGAVPVRGRVFTWGDTRAASPVVLVNESFAARFSPDRDLLGRTLRVGRDGVERTIVGVIPDLLAADIDNPVQHGIYVPMLQATPFAVRPMLRTTGAPIAALPALREAVEAVNSDIAIFEVATLRDAIYAEKGVLTAIATLFLVFGAGALLLTTTGLYGVVAFGVNQRTREMGIRMALGAERRDILALVLRQGGRSITVGTVLGVGLALALTRGLASAIEFVRPFDPLVLSSVLAVLLTTAFAATLVPARRAAGVAPNVALRSD